MRALASELWLCRPTKSVERRKTHVDLHLLVQAIVHDQAVGHSNAVWLHGMSRDIGVVSDIRVIEVSDFLLGFGCPVCTQRIERSK